VVKGTIENVSGCAPRSGIEFGAPCRSLEFNLRGGGAYRAVYLLLESERVCLVFLVGAHEGLYAKAERRRRALHSRLP
jgi:hypothetical protein